MTQNAESTEISTPWGMKPVSGSETITRVPVEGTGLSAAVYAPDRYLGNVGDLFEVMAAQAPDATFTATELLYAGRREETTLAEFVGADAASIEGNPDIEMGPSGIVLTGYLYIPAGVHDVTVHSDDGFALMLGGVTFSAYAGRRGVGDTARTAEFEGGLYEVEILYFDGGGGQALSLEIDGLPVDQSAFYQDPGDLLSPDPSLATIPVADYHPSHTLGLAGIDDPATETGTDARDVIEALGGDDTANAGAGDDEVYGGYGDDALFGGDGNDILDGGRGSDYLRGGAGDDLLIARSDAGEQRIGQLAVGHPTRPDPDGEVNAERQKLYGWEDHPLRGDDIMEGGAGADTFLIAPQINAKLDIIRKHVRVDGTINWAGVAGENDALHDHWVDAFGIETIADYVAGEDQIAIIGHTASICDISYRDTDGDGDLETIITVTSNQSGPCAATGASACNCQSDMARSGGAHDQDLLGIIIVHGDRVEEEDIQLDAGVTYGIVATFGEVAEALYPGGDSKVMEIGGQTVYGYDTRDDAGGLGPILTTPEAYAENPFEALAQFSDPVTAIEYEQTRAPFEPLGTVAVAGEIATGTGGNDVWTPSVDAGVPGTPAPLSYWNFGTGVDGAFADAGAGSGPAAKAYELYENQALLRTGDIVEGPDGTLNALSFDGEHDFAYVPHDTAYNVSQGTIALWVRPDNLSDEQIFVSKDQRHSGEGGHVRLGQTENGGLLLRFAEGDAWRNNTWETGPILTEGAWQHIAVSFTDQGVTVYLDGAAVPPYRWTPVEGSVPSPNVYREAYLINNDEPWVLGADQRWTELNETAQQFAVDDDRLDNAFEGAIAEFALFGGMTADDALDAAEVAALATPGFDITSLTGTVGPQPMLAGDDTYAGGNGYDSIDGGAGDDSLSGDNGNDSIQGGYGDDIVDGGAGDDTLDGGRGSDLVIGGAGNDVLLARSDAGEDRAGQLVLGEPSRPYPDAQIDPEYLKLADWIDQPLVADDILVGGAGNDLFQIETLINGTDEAIFDNVLDGERMIRWHGVAGENGRIHQHWVDSIGIDIIADYVAGEDTISIKGHTTRVDVDHRGHDSDGDGLDDTAVSVITVYSQQGNNGGAHDEDYLGYVVVHGDLVDEDDILTDAGVHYGIVTTIDQLQEAFAPTGETKVRELNGQTLFGYDSRDVAGDPIGTDPEAFSENPYASLVDFGDTTLSDLPPLNLLLDAAPQVFDGTGYTTIANSAELQQDSGTIALSFRAASPGGTDQALFSKDHTGYGEGGHITMWIDTGGYLRVRVQDQTSNRYLKAREEPIEAGQSYDVAFSFDESGVALYMNGTLVDTDVAIPGGMSGNSEEILIGASARQRRGDDDREEWLFRGEIGPVQILDRALTDMEVVLWNEAGGDLDGLPVRDAAGLPPMFEIMGTEAADNLGGTVDDDHLLGLGGIDMLRGGAGDDRMDAGAGGTATQNLYGQTGNDTYVIGQDNGVVRIGAWSENAGSGIYDRVEFTDLTLADLTVTHRATSHSDGTQLVLSWATGEVQIANQGAHIEAFAFADGMRMTHDRFILAAEVPPIVGTEGADVLDGTAAGDEILGLGGIDMIRGGRGDDTLDAGAGGAQTQNLYGQAGNDTYRIGQDNGVVRIGAWSENAGTGTADAVVFSDLTSTEVSASHVDTGLSDGTQLVLSWASDGVSGELQLAARGAFIERFEFADGVELTHDQFDLG